MGYIYITISALFFGILYLFEKLWQNKTENIKNSSAVFILFLSLFSSISYLCFAKFDISLNKTTLIFSLIFAALSVLSTFLALCAISKMNLVLFSVFTKGGTVFVWLYGILFMSDAVKTTGVISFILLTISIVLPLFSIKNNHTKFIGYAIGILMIFQEAGACIMLKYYELNPLKKSDSTLCFYTNLFMLAVIAIYLFASPKRCEIKESIKLSKSHIYLVVLSTLSSSGQMLTNLLALKTLSLAVCSVLLSAISCVAIFIISKIILKEDCSKLESASFILSTIAVILTAF